MSRTTISSHTAHPTWHGKHRFEHWYRDNQCYFLTAKCRDGIAAFRTDAAKAIFWDRFHHYTQTFGFTPFVTSLLDNHYHTLGFLRVGKNLGTMMQRLHGSVAKLVNDTLDERLKPFWRGIDQHDYFDGCIRDEKQCRLAYRYTLNQSVRHEIVTDWHEYAHTVVNVELEPAVWRCNQLGAFMVGVPYKRYQTHVR